MPNMQPYPAMPAQTYGTYRPPQPLINSSRLPLSPGAASQNIFSRMTPGSYSITPGQRQTFQAANPAAPGHYWSFNPTSGQFYSSPQHGQTGLGAMSQGLTGLGTHITGPLSTPGMENLYKNAIYAGLAYGAGSGIAGLSAGGGATGATGAFEGAMAPYQTIGALPAEAGAAGAVGGGTALGATVPVDFAGAGGAGAIGGGGASGFLGSGGAGYIGAGTGAYAPTAGGASGGGLLSQLFGQGGWQNAAILGGANVLGAGIQSNAINQANQANRNAIQQRIRQALAQLSPQQIQQLTQQFLPEIMSVQGPLMQSQIAQFNEAAGQRGLGTAPITGAQETALRASGINSATQQAFERAMGLAGARAGAITGQPVYQQQPNLAYGNVTGDTLNQLLLARYLQQGQQQNPFPYIQGARL